MPDASKRFHIITGGPGAGKTAIVDALAARGLATVEEVARPIIRAQMAIGGTALHWGDRKLYAELMLSHAIADHERAAARKGPVIFDRGIPDLIGYCRLSGLPAPDHFLEAARRYRYAPIVFVAPPWRAIYVNDGERRQDFTEAVATCEAIAAACSEAGYDLAEIPKGPVEARADFVLARIRRHTAC